MRAVAQRVTAPFQPVEISIRFDDQAELDAFKALMGANNTMSRLLRDEGFVDDRARQVLNSMMIDIHDELSGFI